MKKVKLKVIAIILIFTCLISSYCFATFENTPSKIDEYIPIIRVGVNLFCVIFLILAAVSLVISVYTRIVKNKTEGKKKELLKNKNRLFDQEGDIEEASESVRVISEDMEDELSSLDQDLKIYSSRIKFFTLLGLFSLIIPIIRIIVL